MIFIFFFNQKDVYLTLKYHQSLTQSRNYFVKKKKNKYNIKQLTNKQNKTGEFPTIAHFNDSKVYT